LYADTVTEDNLKATAEDETPTQKTKRRKVMAAGNDNNNEGTVLTMVAYVNFNHN
jgi:hypothetical protein